MQSQNLCNGLETPDELMIRSTQADERLNSAPNSVDFVSAKGEVVDFSADLTRQL